MNDNGYYIISKSPIKRFIGKPLHTVIFEEKHKCTVLWELGGVIHHKNRSKTDNRWWNLELMSNSEHIRLHHKKPEEHWIMKNFNCSYHYNKKKYVFDRIINGTHYYLEHENREILNEKLKLLKQELLKNLPQEYKKNKLAGKTRKEKRITIDTRKLL